MDMSMVNHDSPLLYESGWYSILEDKISQENRLADAINARLIMVSEDYTIQEKTDRLTALYEAKLGDKVKLSWQKFVDFINNIFGRFLEAIDNLLKDNKQYLEKYKDIILNKKARIGEISNMPRYDIGIDRCVKTVIPTFNYQQHAAVLREGDEAKSIGLIISDSEFTYDDGRSLAEQLKDYFSGIDKEGDLFTGSLDDLNRKDIYNFCYNSTNIKTICDKDKSHLSSSTNAITSALQKTADANVETESGVLSYDTLVRLLEAEDDQTKSDGTPKMRIDTNPVKSSYDDNEKPQSPEEQAKNTNLNKEDTAEEIGKIANEWIKICRAVITAKCTAMQNAANDYMRIIRAHVKSYTHTKDNPDDAYNKTKDKTTDYSRKPKTNNTDNNE